MSKPILHRQRCLALVFWAHMDLYSMSKWMQLWALNAISFNTSHTWSWSIMDLIVHPGWICSGCLALCKWSVQQPHSRGFSGSRGCAALDTVERLHPSIILYSSIASRESWMPFCGTWRRISWSCCQDDKDMRAQRAARFSSHLERSSTNVGGPSIPVGQRLVEIGAITVLI